MVVGSENDRQSVGGCLENVVDPSSEATPDIGDIAIFIDGGKMADGVDQQDLCPV